MTATFSGGVKNFGADRVNGDYIPASDMNDVRAEIVALETIALAGWLEQSEVWTYASPSTFTVPGDRTAFYTKGRRLRWKPALVYSYGVVRSSTYSAPNTTVTILINNDYVVENMAIGSPAVSDLAMPPGFPDWFNWIPTYSASGSMTYTGCTTQLAKYKTIGKMLFFMFRVSGTLGGTPSTGIYITPPVAPVVITGTYLVFSAGNNETTLGAGVLDTVTPRFTVQRHDSANFSAGASKVAQGEGFYEW